MWSTYMKPSDPDTPQKPSAWAFFAGSGKHTAIWACAEGIVNAAPMPWILRKWLIAALRYGLGQPTLQGPGYDQANEVGSESTNHGEQRKKSHAK
jgi:hypothetical protein